VFNRSFTNSFLKGHLTKYMFIDSPRDYGIQHTIQTNKAHDTHEIEKVKDKLYKDRSKLGQTLDEKVKDLCTDKIKLQLRYTLQLGSPLTVEAITHNKNYVVKSKSLLSLATKSAITEEILNKRFKTFNNSTYELQTSEITQNETQLSIPFSELNLMKKKLGFLLNDCVDLIELVNTPKLTHHPKIKDQPQLSILIADEEDAFLQNTTDSDIYFKLPESLKKDCTKYSDLLLRNPKFIPWFPAVLIGKDYEESVKILEVVKPKKIITNNMGVAFKANELGITWIAGPLLNTTNSHALISLKEKLNASGAFISNEINAQQIKNIHRPKDFKLMYSIYHPVLMMTSRQCFFQRTVGCKKPAIDHRCMLTCQKSTTITNVKAVSFNIDKQKGGYPSIYNKDPFLNLEIIKDLPQLFDEFLIDLTNIGLGSKESPDKVLLIKEFEKILLTPDSSQEILNAIIPESTKDQYHQGL